MYILQHWKLLRMHVLLQKPYYNKKHMPLIHFHTFLKRLQGAIWGALKSRMLCVADPWSMLLIELLSKTLRLPVLLCPVSVEVNWIKAYTK